jgi:hypothetical protein
LNDILKVNDLLGGDGINTLFFVIKQVNEFDAPSRRGYADSLVKLRSYVGDIVIASREHQGVAGKG